MGGKRSNKSKKSKTKAQQAAAKRHAKFKQTRVQTFGGKKTSFSKAEQKRITDAGYSVQGYSKAAPRSGTAVQVSKDIAQYGNTVPSGSFGISEAGRIQAEKNKAEAAAKKAAEAAAKKAADAAAAKKEATRQSTFDSSRLSNAFSDKAFSQYMQAGGISNINRNVFNNPNNYLNRGLNTRFADESKVRFGDPFSTFRKNINPKTLFGDDALQVGKSDKTFAAGKRGNPFGRIDQAFNPFRSADKGGPGSGPTPLTRETIKRFGPTTLNFASSLIPGYNIGKQIFNEGRADSATTKAISNIDNVNVGGLSIGFNSPESTDVGAQVGRFFTSLPGKVANYFAGDTQVASTDAGGLNISSGNEGAEEGGNTGRTLTARFKKPGFDTLAGGLDFATNDRYDFDNLGRGLFGYGAVTPSNVINDAMSIAQNKNLTLNDMGAFLNTVKDVSTSDDKLNTVKNIISNEDTTSRLLGPVYDQLRNSEIVDSLATKKLKLPENYGEQLDQTKGALETAYNSLGDNNKENRKIISDLFIGKNPDLNLLKRAAEQFTNESETIANYDSKTNLAKFQDSFKENSPLFKGLNKDERGLKGSLGNWRLSNLGTKIVGRNLEGTNNFADLASNIIDTAGTDKATQSFIKTIGIKGAPTPKTLIEGALPRFGIGNTLGRIRNQSNNSGQQSFINQGMSPEELMLLGSQPTTAAAVQSGTNPNNLAQVQNQAYNNQLSMYMNPNYFAQFRQPRFNTQPLRFRNIFNRGYF
tara:strand:+ start:474 stop:2735 length:2262 start_codon:yes stop_codon:yes gene_type:complete